MGQQFGIGGWLQGALMPDLRDVMTEVQIIDQLLPLLAGRTVEENDVPA